MAANEHMTKIISVIWRWRYDSCVGGR